MEIDKKLATLVNGLSLKPLLLVLMSSFILSSTLSLVIAFFLVPVDRPPKKSRIIAGSIPSQVKTLTEADQKAIIKRNIFNSEGKVGDAEPEIKNDGTKSVLGSLVKSSLPIKVRGIIFSGDPQNGLAMLENTQKRKVKSYIIGDVVVNNAKLIEIYDDRVIFERSGQREYLELEPFQLKRSRRKKGRGGSAPKKISRIATKPPPESYKEAGFERKGTDITLSEEYKRGLLRAENMTKILQDAKAEPNIVNGELKGFRLTRIRENSVYEKAGFQNNDIVEEINGLPLRDAAGAIRLLQQLKKAKEIEVRLNRGGSSLDMNITIQ